MVEIWLDLSFVFRDRNAIFRRDPPQKRNEEEGGISYADHMADTHTRQHNCTPTDSSSSSFHLFFLLVIFGVACRGRLSAPLIISPSSW
jgi:hypothetical protein